MGDVERALSELRALLRACSSQTSSCDRMVVAELYRDLGVVLADGRAEHDRAVQAFSEALMRDPDTELPQQYQTPRAARAFDEARTRVPASGEGGGAAATAPSRTRRSFILVDAVGRYGALSGPWNYTSAATGQVGGALTLGLLPGDGKFSMAGRLRGGAYFGDYGSVGFGGAAGLVGGVWNRPGQRDFGYLYGGVGLDLVGSDATPVLNFSGVGGVTVNHIDLGIGVEFGFGDQFAMALIGLHVGFGSML